MEDKRGIDELKKALAANSFALKLRMHGEIDYRELDVLRNGIASVAQLYSDDDVIDKEAVLECYTAIQVVTGYLDQLKSDPEPDDQMILALEDIDAEMDDLLTSILTPKNPALSDDELFEIWKDI